jgi:prepilin-type N-terminal cleavage/methylation domain-containing protein/prepilin-type processing-associated H-X9-DG protein
MKACRRFRAAGFTLVEMLIVVAIIALLIGLLVPTVSRGKDLANRTRCQGNMRELVMAANQFAKDNDVYPDRDKWLREESSQGIRSGQLYKYTGEAKLFRCPADLELLSSDSGGRSARLGSYKFNSWWHQRNANVLPDMSLAVMFMEPATGENADTSPSFDPSSTPTLSDRHGNGGNLAFGDGHTEYITRERFERDQEKIFRETRQTTN